MSTSECGPQASWFPVVSSLHTGLPLRTPAWTLAANSSNELHSCRICPQGSRGIPVSHHYLVHLHHSSLVNLPAGLRTAQLWDWGTHRCPTFPPELTVLPLSPHRCPCVWHHALPCTRWGSPHSRPPLPCTAHSQRELLVSDSLGPSPRAIRRLLIAWADDRPLRLKW